LILKDSIQIFSHSTNVTFLFGLNVPSGYHCIVHISFAVQTILWNRSHVFTSGKHSSSRSWISVFDAKRAILSISARVIH
jgi:hypothetical protein